MSAQTQRTPGPRYGIVRDSSLNGKPIINVAKIGKALDRDPYFPRFSVQYISGEGKIEREAYERCFAKADIFDSLEDAFVALGREGGNTLGTDARYAWENARAALANAGAA